MSWPIHKRRQRIALLAKRQAELDAKVHEDLQHISDMEEETRTNLSDIDRDMAKSEALTVRINKIRNPRYRESRERRDFSLDTHDYSHREEIHSRIATQEQDLKIAQENYKVAKNEYHRERRKSCPDVKLLEELRETKEKALKIQEETALLLQEMNDEISGAR